jgi:hypothetical protein
MAFVYGRIGDGKNVLTRLHRANDAREGARSAFEQRSVVLRPALSLVSVDPEGLDDCPA